jgi:hypothetical protein
LMIFAKFAVSPIFYKKQVHFEELNLYAQMN